MVHRFRLLPTLSRIPSERANTAAVVAIVVVEYSIVVDAADTIKSYSAQPVRYLSLSLFLHAIVIRFTSETSPDQYSARSKDIISRRTESSI